MGFFSIFTTAEGGGGLIGGIAGLITAEIAKAPGDRRRDLWKSYIGAAAGGTAVGAGGGSVIRIANNATRKRLNP